MTPATKTQIGSNNFGSIFSTTLVRALSVKIKMLKNNFVNPHEAVIKEKIS